MNTADDRSKSTYAKRSSIKDELNANLPEGFQCKVRYIQTPSRRCDPLFSPPPGHEAEKTRLASHFLLVSMKSPGARSAVSGSGAGYVDDVVVLGMEVLVYTTGTLTTIFVSKADSTGYLPRQKPSVTKTITTTFLQWLSERQRQDHPDRKLVISLFARAQSQYLFPGSAENVGKHVLDDRQLIKWWVRVLDPLFPRMSGHLGSSGSQRLDRQGYITVPGYESPELKSFLPVHSNSSGAAQHWKPGNPLVELAATRKLSPDAPTRCLLPRFPDDPKARFMQDLDDEIGLSGESHTSVSPSKRKSGAWKSVRGLDRFWEAMEFRQECSSGRVVGFLWLVIDSEKRDPETLVLEKNDEEIASRNSHESSSTRVLSGDSRSPSERPLVKKKITQARKRVPLSGLIRVRKPKLKGSLSTVSVTSNHGAELKCAERGGLLLTEDDYDKVMHTLLHLDFASVEVAARSTVKWASEVSSVRGIQDGWGFLVTGTAKVEQNSTTTGGSGNQQVNDLGGMIRKKRKTEDVETSEGDIAAGGTGVNTVGKEIPAVNVLGASMIRKKPKTSS